MYTVTGCFISYYHDMKVYLDIGYTFYVCQEYISDMTAYDYRPLILLLYFSSLQDQCYAIGKLGLAGMANGMTQMFSNCKDKLTPMHPLTLKTGGCVALKFLCEVEMFSLTVIEYCRRTCNKCDETTPRPEEPSLSNEIDDVEDDDKTPSPNNNNNQKSPNGPGKSESNPNSGGNGKNSEGGNQPSENGVKPPSEGGQNSGPNPPSANNCVDRVNPTTGISDCPSRAHLCKNPLYQQLMEEQCPKTCNKCEPVIVKAPSLVCRDMINRVTGISDCPNRAHLCRNSLYSSLMRQQCPFTCGYC